MAFLKFIGKSCGFVGYVIQYACVTHCTFEYIGDFVMVWKKSNRYLDFVLSPTDIEKFLKEAPDSQYVATKCSGPSMEPTLESNNVLLTEHVTPRLQRLRRGDIVIAKSPTNPKQNICKRIKGLPGDSVRGHFPKRSQVVPKGHVWLEGDNSSNSADSRVYGPVPQGLIRSRVVCRVWPLDKMASLTEY